MVDAGYGYQHTETKRRGAYEYGKIKRSNINVHSRVMNGNRWGLKGSEDLGNGTSAIFILESGFDLANGESIQGGRLFGRQALVGLTSENWGTFSIGRQYNAGETFVAPIDPFGTGGGFAAANSIFGNSIFDRYDSSIKYMTPNLGGFKFGVSAVGDDSEIKYSGSFGDYKVASRRVGVSTGLSYSYGAIYIGAIFDYIEQKDRDPEATPAPIDSRHKTKAWNIGSTYDFDVAKLRLLYCGRRDGSIGGVGMLAARVAADAPIVTTGFDGGGLKQHSWLAGITAPVGDAGNLMFSYAGNVVKNEEVADNFKVKSFI